MTTDDLLQPGLPAATRRLRRGAARLACAALFSLASLGALAQEAPAASIDGNAPPMARAAVQATTSPTVQPADETSGEPAALQSTSLSERIQFILSKAMTLLGTPYRWGGTSPEGGFDCSGLVGYVFRTTLGIELPRVSTQLAHSGQPVARTALVPGDLVFFGPRGRVNHVGIYVGEGRFLHAPSRGKDVRVDELASSYWSGRFLEGRRVTM